MDISVSYLAVAASAVLAMVLGFLWYGPLFGKQWAHLMGFSEVDMARAKEKGMTTSYVLMAVFALVQAYVIAHFIALLGVDNPTAALQLGFWSWLGFVATTQVSMVLWEGKSWTLFAIVAGYYLVSIEVMALVLTWWPI